MDDTVRVLVVDDSATTRSILREALDLAGGIEVVGEASDGRGAVASALDLQPDVVLMDIRMPEGDGIDAAREITSRLPSTRVVALTWADDAATVRDMLAAGAMGYVVKGGTMDELASAIRRARAGEPELDQRVIPAAVEDLRRLLEQEVERREEAERLDRVRGEFVQDLSHELRTPLTLITGALKMLAAARLQDDQAQMVDIAIRRAERLAFMIEGLELLATRPAARSEAAAEEAVRTAMVRTGVVPDRQDTPEDAWEGVPQEYLDRVAIELLSNAAAHGRSPIEVRSAREGCSGVLTVRDAGGWSASESDFAAFSQRDMSHTRRRGGFGLGLFVASRLCQACGGSLTVTEQGGATVAEARFRTS
jgi:DNA-binding NarL/FixJ family response regulator